MNEPSATLTIACNNGDECNFNGNDIELNISIKNTGTTPFMIPLDYIKKAGPTIKITDQKTGQFVFLKKNLADPKLREQPTPINSNQTTSLDWIILAPEIRQFGKEKGRLTVEITLQGYVPKSTSNEAKTLDISGSFEIAK